MQSHTRVTVVSGPMQGTQPKLVDWLRERPFALAMSSGFFGFFAHCGMLTVLEDEGLLPTRLSGSSAGALVAGAWASGVDAPTFSRELHVLRREDFWDPRLGAGLLAGRLFRARLEATLAARSFDACRVPLAVSAFEVLRRRTRILDSGDLAAAIHASCAVPFLFHPVVIDRVPLVDGGVSDRPGLAGMPHGERVFFHHLASRSPWRTTLEVPRREGMIALVIDGLPRLGPFRLEIGPRAFEAARAATKRALRQPIANDRVVVT